MRPDPNVVTEALELLLDRHEHDRGASRAELATGLAVEPAAVDLAAEHLLTERAVTESDAGLELTGPGHALAVEVVRRHRLTERLLLDVIGIEWSKVHHEAERWEGVISEEVEARLIELLGDPGTCPHGNPIPGSANRPDHHDAVRLDHATRGPVHIVRITEELESDDAALRLLEDCGFIPGRDAEVKAIDDTGVEVAGTIADAHVPLAVAQHTYVAAR